MNTEEKYLTIKMKNNEMLKLSWVDWNTGNKNVILYLHGLGLSKNDLIYSQHYPEISKYRLIAFDFPGCGNSEIPEYNLSVYDLVEVVNFFLDEINVKAIHLVGHSIGGLVGLLFAHKYQHRVNSFINAEGNLAPEDCRVFSRYVFEDFHLSGINKFIKNFKRRLLESGRIGYDMFVETFERNVSPEALYNYSKSIVEISDSVPLLNYFIDLNMPCAFLYGEANNDLPYLKELKKKKIKLIEIPGCDHFPLYCNEADFYKEISGFLGGTNTISI